MKKFWRKIRPKLLPPIIYGIARFIGATVRLEVEGSENLEGLKGGALLAGWHGRTLLAASLFRNKGYWTIISHSRDGEMQNQIFKRFGFQTIRGSTGRGGVKAAAESIRVLKKGAIMAFTPDGPRGPSGEIQPGIILMAKKSGAAIIPVAIAAKRRWFAPTWDRYMVPFPFTKALAIYGGPIYIPQDATDKESEQVRMKVQQELHNLQKRADERFGHTSVEPNPEDES